MKQRHYACGLSALAACVGFAAWLIAAWRKRLVLEALGQQVLDRLKRETLETTRDAEETEVPDAQ
jgi:hypothetical protein